MHEWGEEDFDWAGLNAAGRYIEKNLLRWGRVNIRDCKEKYGTLRIYLSLGWYGLHSLTHPRHVYCRYPKWLWKFDIYYISKLFRLLNYIVVPYHVFLYRLFYKRAVQKWPHLADEILCAADYHEALEGILPEYEKWKLKLREIRKKKEESEEDGEDEASAPTEQGEGENGV